MQNIFKCRIESVQLFSTSFILYMKSQSDSSEEAKTNIHASINFIYLFTLCEPQSGLLLPGHGWVFFFFSM